jgi:hypothetical protein
MCDLNGTFAVRNRLAVKWNAFGPAGVILAGNAVLDSWSIRHITVSGGSTVQVDSVPCGGQAPDLCTVTFLNEAFTQNQDPTIWQGPNMPFSSTTTTINDPDPGEAFVTPTEANLLGVSLASPLGAWPAAWNAAGLTWLGPTPTYTAPDEDGDGFPGVASIIKTTGTSTVCGEPYSGLPDPSGTTSQLIDRAYIGTRVLGGYNGTIMTTPAATFGKACDVMTGSLTGPAAGGFPEVDGRVRGCRLVGGAACAAATWQSLDTQASSSPQTTTAARFSMVRVANSSITCATVRAMAFPCVANADCSGGTPTCNTSTGQCQ